MITDFLAIGELLADIISTNYCEGLSGATGFQMFQGGSPANVAANLNYLGKKAALISCVGNDGIGTFLLAQIRQIGLSDDLIQVSQSEPTSIVMVGKSKQTPDFIAYRGADTQLEHIDKELLGNTMVVHTTAFALSRQPARHAIFTALKTAHDLGKIISIDWNFAPPIWGTDDGKTVFKSIMDLQPYLKVSLDDMERFFGHLSLEEYKAILDQYTFSFICMTCGKDGVWYKKKNDEWQFKIADPVKHVVDTTGAGDAFWAGFMQALIDKQTPYEGITNALEIASRKVQKHGPLYTHS